MNKIIYLILIFLIILPARAYSIEMGTVTKNDFSKINSDESAKFTVLFWNADNESYKLELSSELPEDWIIFFEPNNFILNETTGEEYIKLPYQADYKKATSVDIIVKPPSSVKPGNYTITVKARYVLPQDGISFSQERLFNFLVEVENPLYFEDSKPSDTSQKSGQISTGNFISNEEKIDFSYFYIAIVFIILFISTLIYKRS